MFLEQKLKELEERIVELEKKVDAPRRNLPIMLDGKVIGVQTISRIS